jgi:hypothetical protein
MDNADHRFCLLAFMVAANLVDSLTLIHEYY